MYFTKNALIVSMIALFFMGCDHDQASTVEKTPMLDFAVLNTEDGTYKTYSLPMPGKEHLQATEARTNAPQSVTGTFHVYTGSYWDVAAILNPSGIHGTTVVQSSAVGELTAEAVCVSTEDGYATAAALITSVGSYYYPWNPGVIFYFKYKDNGEGANAPPDQTSSIVFFILNWYELYPSPEAFVADFPCQYIDQAWYNYTLYNTSEGEYIDWGPYRDILDGNIKVK